MHSVTQSLPSVTKRKIYRSHAYVYILLRIRDFVKFFTKQFINLLDFLFTKCLKLYTIKQIIYSSPKFHHMLVLTYYLCKLILFP